MGMFERLHSYAALMRIDRPIGSLLLLWPTLWALWIAGAGRPDAKVTAIFIVGVFVMRAAGCVINDYADRDIDPHVARTRERPLASGKISRHEALLLFMALSAIALALVLLLNRLSLWLALVGIVMAAIYPFVKRVTQLPQLFLGVVFSWGIPMAFAAQTGRVSGLAWVLLLANLCWVVAYDTLYAMVDREDDLRIGVKSIAILTGSYDLVVVAVGYIGALGILFWIGLRLGLNHYYFAALLIAAVFAVIELYSSKDRQPERCFAAFLNNTWWGAAVFVGLLLAYL